MTNAELLLLEKVFLLGKKLEQRVYNNNQALEPLEPWTFHGHDPIKVQQAGKKISEFIGMPNLTFVISYTKQVDDTAGHIELNNNSDEGVFIEIDDQYKSEPAMILSILSHEICHKLIHINGLTLPGYENEILTDVATIYTGLGKLSLNGCEVVKESTTNNADGGTTTKTTTKKVGYLNRKKFAFVYKVICAMRKIPDKYATAGLNSSAKAVLDKTMVKLGPELFDNSLSAHEVKAAIKEANHDMQKALALNTKLSKTIRANIAEIKQKNLDAHKKVKSTTHRYISDADDTLKPDSLNYIKNMLLVNNLKKISGIHKKEENELTSINDQLQKVFSKEDDTFPINLKERNPLYNLKCPVCTHNMRLQQDKLVKVKCKKCDYSFMVDNKKVEQEKLKKKEKKKRSFRKKFKAIMEIIRE